mgnify:FL=1
MFKASVNIGGVTVSIETDVPYPDVANDLTNRAAELMKQTLAEVRTSGWTPFDIIDVDDDDD